MRPETIAFFNRAHRLDGAGSGSDVVPCKICGGPSRLFDFVDFLKFCHHDPYGFGFSGVNVGYRRCSRCDFIFTAFFDDWTPADFGRHIYNQDYGLVDGDYAAVRPAAMAAGMARLLDGLTGLRMLDYGSGSGVFAARMRTLGFDHIASYDPFSNPVRPSDRFDVITCFEVIEHTPQPCQSLADMQSFLAPGGCIVFNQALQPPDIEQLRGNWWYIAPRNGHVSIFSADSLAQLAATAGLAFHKGQGLYAFAGSTLAPNAAEIVRRIGLPFRGLRLLASESPIDPSAWHGIEMSGARRFRWTASSEIGWPAPSLPSYPCRVAIKVPWVNQIAPGFAEGCRLRIGHNEVALAAEPGRLVAEAIVPEPLGDRLFLVTPPPLSPHALRDAPDRRMLGLAIPLDA
jgi:SAM-dependent methyltransferase